MVTKCVYLYQYKTGNSIPGRWEFYSRPLGDMTPGRREIFRQCHAGVTTCGKKKYRRKKVATMLYALTAMA